MMNEQKSVIIAAVHVLRRYWIPVAVVALLSLTIFAGQPAWAADGGSNINQTVPTPTPSAPPVETPEPASEPTATPAPDNGGGSGGGEENSVGEATAPVEAPPAAPIEAVGEVPTSTAALTGTVTAVTLNVRQGPGITNPVIGRLTAGSTVNVLARNADGAWLLVCCITGGSNGWVSAQFIAPNFSAAEAAALVVSNSLVTTATVTSPVTGTVAAAVKPLEGNGAVDVLTLNIRQGPSTSTPVVGRFRQGDTFAVQGTNEAGNWYLVCCVPGSQASGWISAQYATLASGAADAAAAETPAAPAEATPTEPAPTEAAPAEPAPDSTEATPTSEAPAESTDAGSSETASGVTDVLW